MESIISRTVTCTIGRTNEEERVYSASMDDGNSIVSVAGPSGDIDVPVMDIPYLIRVMKEFEDIN